GRGHAGCPGAAEFLVRAARVGASRGALGARVADLDAGAGPGAEAVGRAVIRTCAIRVVGAGLHLAGALDALEGSRALLIGISDSPAQVLKGIVVDADPASGAGMLLLEAAHGAVPTALGGGPDGLA